MKFNFVLYHAVLATLLPTYEARPGSKWTKRLDEIKARALAPIDSADDSNELIGDLVDGGGVSPVGKVCMTM